MSSNNIYATSNSEQTKEQEQVQGADSVQNIPNRRKLAKPAAKSTEKAPQAFRTISEVADELGVQQHVLRFWESKFSYIKPLKRGGGRRYYRPEDVTLLKSIHSLLYTEGYTIKGVQKLLQKTRGNLDAVLVETASEVAAEEVATPVAEKSPIKKAVDKNRTELQSMLDELKAMRDLIG